MKKNLYALCNRNNKIAGKHNKTSGKCLCFDAVYTPAAMARKKVSLLRMLNEARLKKLQSAANLLENINALYRETSADGELLLNDITQKFLDDLMCVNVAYHDSSNSLKLGAKSLVIEKLQKIIFENIAEITWEDTRNPYYFELVALHLT